MNRNFLLSFLILITGFVFVTGVSAQPELDTSFNSTGRANYTQGIGGASKIAVQADRKAILVGTCSDINLITYPFCYMRLNENGSFDNTYVNGLNRIAPPGANPSGSSLAGIALLSDEKLLMAGSSPISGESKVALVRLNTNGTLDTSFGGTGIIVSDLVPGTHEIAKNMALQPDGKILVTGYLTNININDQQFVARYNADGTLDTTFGTSGIVKTILASAGAQGRSIAVQPDSKIIVGGSKVTNTEVSYVLTRFTSSGAVDNTWHGDGIITIPHGTSPATDEPGFRAVGTQLDGRVVALGYKGQVYSFNPNGTPDMTFNGSGVRDVWTNANIRPYDMMVTASGRILVTGNTSSGSASGSQYLFAISKFKSDGNPDTAFSGDGYLTSEGNHSGRAMTFDSAGRLVIGGFMSQMVTPFEQPQFLGVRLLAPTPHGVGISGRVTDVNGSPVRSIVVSLQHNGVTFATARTNPFGYYGFQNVQSGQYYGISIKARGGSFPSRSFFLDDEVTNMNITGQ